MKAGISDCGASYDGNGREEQVLRYWVLPDKPQKPMRFGSIMDEDGAVQQTKQICAYLENALKPGSWSMMNHRFYFAQKEDWEMFQTMCLIGWA